MIKKLGAVLVLVFIFLAIAPAGSPVQFSYVYSDSMSPTVETNDGFLLVPSDGFESGDIVTFRSSKRDQYVTHRIVERTGEGYVTKGDNNPTTDQAAGAPPVGERDILGEVLTINGQPLTIPGYGDFLNIIRDYRLLALGIVAGILLLQLVTNGGQPPRIKRSTTRTQDVLLPIFVVSLVAGTGILLLGASGQEMTYIAVDSQSESPQTLTVGESQTTTVLINESGIPVTHQFVSVDGAAVTNTTRNGSAIALELRVPPPSTAGPVSVQVHVHQYPAVVPRTLLSRLHRVSPTFSAGITTLIVLGSLSLLSLLVVDRKTPLRPPRSHWSRRLSGGDEP